MTEYTELKRLAEHAFNGPWTFTEIDPDDKSWGACELQNKDGAFIATHVCGVFNASYIAAASPDVVLSMIAEIDNLRTQNQALVEACKTGLEYVEECLIDYDQSCAAHPAIKAGRGIIVSDVDAMRAAIKLAEGKDV